MSKTWTTHRARVASLTRSRAADDPELIEARRELRFARAADYLDSLLTTGPELAPAQRERLAARLLGGGA